MNLHETTGVESTQEIVIASGLTLPSISYKKGDFLIISFTEDGLPTFSLVDAFVSIPGSDSWWVVLQKYDTLGFVTHFHPFEVSTTQPTEYNVIALDKLVDHCSLFGYKICFQQWTVLIRMHHNVFGSTF